MSSFKIENKIDCKKDNSKLNNRAIQKPLTANPSKNSLAKRIIQALMTKRNKPRVTMVIGKVRITRIGFKMAFNNANTTATIMAPVNPATSTPGSSFAKTTTATAVSKILMIRFMVVVGCWLLVVGLNILLFSDKLVDNFKKFSWVFCMKPMSCIRNRFNFGLRKMGFDNAFILQRNIFRPITS